MLKNTLKVFKKKKSEISVGEVWPLMKIIWALG